MENFLYVDISKKVPLLNFGTVLLKRINALWEENGSLCGAIEKTWLLK